MSIIQIDPSTIQIDDNYPLVTNRGFWATTSFYGLGLLRDTLSYTNKAGSTKLVRFVGTSITVWGGLQEYAGTGNAALVIQGSVDDAHVATYAPASPSQYAVVRYYQSPTLPMGEHVLKITNMADGDIVHLDSFVIQAAEGQRAQVLPLDGPPVQAPPTSTTARVPAASPSVIVSLTTKDNTVVITSTLQNTDTPLPTIPSSTSTPNSPPPSSGGSRPSSSGSQLSHASSDAFSASSSVPSNLSGPRYLYLVNGLYPYTDILSRPYIAFVHSFCS